MEKNVVETVEVRAEDIADIASAQIAHKIVRSRSPGPDIPCLQLPYGKGKNHSIPVSELFTLLRKEQGFNFDVVVRTRRNTQEVKRFKLPSGLEVFQAMLDFRQFQLQAYQAMKKIDRVDLLYQDNEELRGVDPFKFFIGTMIGMNILIIDCAVRYDLDVRRDPGYLHGKRLEVDFFSLIVPRKDWPAAIRDWILHILAKVPTSIALGLLETPEIEKKTGDGKKKEEEKTLWMPTIDWRRFFFYVECVEGFDGLLGTSTQRVDSFSAEDEYLIVVVRLEYTDAEHLLIQDNPWTGNSAFMFRGPKNEIAPLLQMVDPEATREERREQRQALRKSKYFVRPLRHHNHTVGAGDWEPTFARAIAKERKKPEEKEDTKPEGQADTATGPDA